MLCLCLVLYCLVVYWCDLGDLGEIWGGNYWGFKGDGFYGGFFKCGCIWVENWFDVCLRIVIIFLRCCNECSENFFWLVVVEVFNLNRLSVVLVVDYFFWWGYLDFMWGWW